MRLESNKNDTYRVWLSNRDYQQLLEAAPDEATRLVVRLGAEVGLRHAETAAATPGDLYESRVDLSNVPVASVELGERTHLVSWLTVHGKDTTGEIDGGKRRDAFVPDDVARDLKLYAAEHRLDDDEPYLSVTARTIRRWISDLGESIAAETDDPDWRHLSTHDLRRYYATDLLQRHGMNPEVVMAVGGWGSYQALKPYLQQPVEEVIAAEFANAGLL